MRSGAEDQERIHETSLVQNGGFIKAQGQDLWAGRAAAPAGEGWLIIYLGVGRGLRMVHCLRNFGSKVSRTLRGLAMVGKRSLTTV